MARQLLCILALAGFIVVVVPSKYCAQQHNVIRKREGLPPLKYSFKLQDEAGMGVCDEATRKSLTTRLTLAGYKFKGEPNEIAVGDEDCKDTVKKLLKKNGKNTVLSNHTEIGCLWMNCESARVCDGSASQSWDIICTGGDVEVKGSCIYATGL